MRTDKIISISRVYFIFEIYHSRSTGFTFPANITCIYTIRKFEFEKNKIDPLVDRLPEIRIQF